MSAPEICIRSKRVFMPFILMFILVFIVYSNSFYSSWHFDDYANIVNNPIVHINDLRFDSLFRTFFASVDKGQYQSDKIYRPIPMLTFALNWYFGKDNIFGYHLANFFIHLLTTSALFVTFYNLFDSPNLSKKNQNAFFISMLAASLWAIHPIQTQAVTYIVQRMAELAALFYILSIYFFLRARNAVVQGYRFLFFFLCGFFFLFSLFSKENAITLPFSLLLIELTFYRDLNDPVVKKKFFQYSLTVLVFATIIGIAFFWVARGNPIDVIIDFYGERPFGPLERILTEHRILIFYLSQVLYPIPARFSIYHDVSISTSLFSPWVTLPAIIMIIGLIGFGIYSIKRWPLISFGILFFFLTHSVESTILPLEIIFEHRNYLPSMFIFLSISTLLWHAVRYYQLRNRAMYFIINSSIILLIVLVGCGTYIRNFVWATEKSLWEDAVTKAPNSARVYCNLASGYYQKIGNYRKCIELYEKSLSLKTERLDTVVKALFNLGNNYSNLKQWEQGIWFYQKVLELSPDFRLARYRLTLVLMKSGKLEHAENEADFLLSLEPNNPDYLYLKGLILLKQKNIDSSIVFFKRMIRVLPNDHRPYLAYGVSLNMLGNFELSNHYLLIADRFFPAGNMNILFHLIVNSAERDNDSDVRKYVERLFTIFTINEISQNILNHNDGFLALPISKKILSDIISDKLHEKAESVSSQ